MKFIKITTKHTDEQLRELMSKLSISEIDFIEKTYDKFNYVEFINEIGNKCMFASIDSSHITDLLSTYVSLSLDFIYEDLTKEALYNNIPTDNADVLAMLESYIDDNLDADTVLDKILELGKESLTDKDILVLSKV